jgi:SPP1 gp7 family putative phage head morphogenesis protein
MCAPSPELALVACGVDAADIVLARSFGVRLTKAAVTTPRGFERAVARLAGLLGGRAAPIEDAAARAATRELDVDWRELAPRARDRAVERAKQAAREAARALPARLRATLERAAVSVVGDVRREARLRQGLAIGVDFNAVDHRVLEHVTRAQTNFVRDEFGRRSEALSERARVVVADGLEQGLGNDEIARGLEATAGRVLRGKSPFYWDVVAASFTGTARSYAQVSAYAEAGIERYRFVAVMDQHTTPICRFMNGRTFSVRRALDQLDRIHALDDPERIKDVRPWGREARDPETGRTSLYVNQGGVRIVLAVSEHAERGSAASFRAKVTDEQLEGFGFSMPPAHALCRSTTISI